MVVTDLQTARRPSSSRRHPPLRSIMKDETGMYSVSTPLVHGPSDEATTLADLRLRMNAMELNQQVLMRELAVLYERGTPFTGAVVPAAVSQRQAANVIPMRKTGPTHVVASEQSKVDQGPTPVPAAMVQGALALALPAPSNVTPLSDASTAKPVLTGVANAEPRYVKKDNAPLPRQAANEATFVPPEVVSKLQEITDESPEVIADMAFQYGMDAVEASEILHREYSRREHHAYKMHGISRDEIKLIRLLEQKGMEERGSHVYHKSINTAFKDWWCETEARMKYLAFRSEDTRARHALPASHQYPLVPGEAVHRDRDREKLKATMRKPKGTYQKSDDIATTLKGAGDPAVTTDSQLKAVKSFIREVGDRFRRTKVANAIGIKPKLRTAKLRQRYEDEFIGSSVDYAQRFPNLERNLKSMSTVRILRAAKPWSELKDAATVKDKMNLINRECVKRGTHTPIDMMLYQDMVNKAYADVDKDFTVTQTKAAA